MAWEITSWALTDVDNVKLFLNITVGTWDDLFVQLVNSASAFVEKSADRKLAARNYNRATLSDMEDTWLDGDNTIKLVLKQYPINSVSYVEINGVEISAMASDDYYASAGYAIYHRQGMLYYESGWSSGIRNVRASYNAGYAEATPEREELRELCNALVALTYKTKESLGMKSETIGNYSYTNADLKGIQLMFGVDGARIINRYRRKWGGK